MPHKIDLDEIARKNPRLDLEEVARWRRLRRILIETGMRGKRERGSSPFAGGRARIVDDAESDPRLVKLSRE
jgi:hypothetical protein